MFLVRKQAQRDLVPWPCLPGRKGRDSDKCPSQWLLDLCFQHPYLNVHPLYLPLSLFGSYRSSGPLYILQTLDQLSYFPDSNKEKDKVSVYDRLPRFQA